MVLDTGDVNPYEAVEIIRRLEQFYKKYSVDRIVENIDVKKLAIYLAQLDADIMMNNGRV